MKRALYFIVFLSTFFVALDVFVPKQKILYLALSHAKTQNVEVLQQVSGAYVMKAGGLTFIIKDIEISSFLFVSKITSSQIALEQLSDLKISDASFANSLFSPLVFSFTANSQLGSLNGIVNISKKSLHINFADVKENESKLQIIASMLNTKIIKTNTGYEIDVTL